MRQLNRHAGWSGICGLIMLMLAAPDPRTEAFAAQVQVNWKADWEATRRAAEKEGRLNIYGAKGIDQQRLYSDVFQQTFPKIKVNYTPGRISEIISRIMAEQRAGIRQADLVLGGTDILLGTLTPGLRNSKTRSMSFVRGLSRWCRRSDRKTPFEERGLLLLVAISPKCTQIDGTSGDGYSNRQVARDRCKLWRFLSLDLHSKRIVAVVQKRSICSSR